MYNQPPTQCDCCDEKNTHKLSLKNAWPSTLRIFLYLILSESTFWMNYHIYLTSSQAFSLKQYILVISAFKPCNELMINNGVGEAHNEAAHLHWHSLQLQLCSQQCRRKRLRHPWPLSRSWCLARWWCRQKL